VLLWKQSFLWQYPSCICIAKTSSYVYILPRFDATLLEMEEDGTLQRIYDKYITE